ncbi:MAG: ABC transporter substrate-binding protein [Phyllobacteriaceae bacterium]|nr:ABC transporter substrate-binding protein [Phyllobacteriaceae bacterium]MBA89846.1 ABC transporter substrate-binding protein [Phyllobacteriaceae bacterium]
MHRLRIVFALIAAAFMTGASQGEPVHAISMHGEPALPAGYEHFPYANPQAPKGGRIVYAVRGTFNSVNPFIVQGDAARGLFDQEFGYNVFESLMARSRDEAFTLYPLIARSVETDEERTFIEFTLDERARFSDGAPIRVEDVLFSMKLMKEKARPLYRRWLDGVESIEKTGERGVRFTFNEKADRELPLLLALLPILPEHATAFDTFDRSTLEPMVASGPYVMAQIDPGQSITLTRNPDYWAKDHPSKRGFDNYDEIRIDYFRDEATMFEAFKKGLVDVFVDKDPVRWKNEYGFPGVADGRIVKSEFEEGLPSGMLGFVFNTRRPLLSDKALRKALAALMDFEWINRNLYDGSYTRTKSFFDGSELASHGRPASDAEKALLAPFPQAVEPAAMAGTLEPPSSDGSGRDRTFLRHAFNILKEAGYTLENQVMTTPDGQPVQFEILLKGKSGEALASAWQRTLAALGIRVELRSVDDAQYQQRLQTYDYDVMMQFYYSSLSPGAEQIGRWGSAARDLEGTYNFAGVANPAVDAMIDALLKARDKDDFVTAVRAYDRVLLSGHYLVQLYHLEGQRVAHSSAIRHPAATPVYGYQLQTWWREE